MARAIDRACSPFIPGLKRQRGFLSNQIKNLKEITLGKNGVILEQNSYSALFLPEVATEQGWSKEELLNNLAQKAGLQTDAWRKKESQFKIFSTMTIP